MQHAAEIIPVEALRESALVDEDVLRHVDELREECLPRHGPDCGLCQRLSQALAELRQRGEG